MYGKGDGDGLSLRDQRRTYRDGEEEEEQGLVIGLVVVRDPRSWAFEERPMGIGGVPSRR